MAIRKQLVERMSGKVNLSSEEGVGTAARIDRLGATEPDTRATSGRREHSVGRGRFSP